jgi:hypothetical protein
MAKMRQFSEDASKRIADATKKVERLSSGNPFQAYSKSFDDYLPGPIPFVVELILASGSAGSGSTTCDYTYDVYRYGTAYSGSPILLQGAAGPLKPRDIHTQYSEAGYGLAYQELDGTIQLLEAYEQIVTDTCEGAASRLDPYID